MELITIFIYVIAFLFSVILHEIAHGFVAYYFGDHTAKSAGRLSLNPLVHIDPFGSILVPLGLILSQSGIVFGWAKPVPVNPYQLKSLPWSYRAVSLAGIATNLIIAVISAIVIKITAGFLGLPVNNLGVITFFTLMQINVILAVFNALPFPGFDGFNLLMTFKPVYNLVAKTPLANPIFIANFGLFISLFLLILFSSWISRLFEVVFGLIATIVGI